MKKTNSFKEENAKLKEKDHISSENSADEVQKFMSSFRILSEEEIENLEKLEEIGVGGGGKVVKVAIKKLYALKQMVVNNSSFKDLQNFIQEYEIINMLNHPNVIEAIGIFMSNESIPPSILLEYCPNNLQKAIEDKILTNEEVVEIIYQIVEAMKYIHSKKIIHRNLKPTNILIATDGTVKICDFGIS